MVKGEVKVWSFQEPLLSLTILFTCENKPRLALKGLLACAGNVTLTGNNNFGENISHMCSYIDFHPRLFLVD